MNFLWILRQIIEESWKWFPRFLKWILPQSWKVFPQNPEKDFLRTLREILLESRDPRILSKITSEFLVKLCQNRIRDSLSTSVAILSKSLISDWEFLIIVRGIPPESRGKYHLNSGGIHLKPWLTYIKIMIRFFTFRTGSRDRFPGNPNCFLSPILFVVTLFRSRS